MESTDSEEEQTSSYAGDSMDSVTETDSDIALAPEEQHPYPNDPLEKAEDQRTNASGRGEMSYTDLNILFTNDKLKKEPLTVVIRSDPFCIPRVTDNVPEYRPILNPLNILESEEKLLPRYFRLDPSEGIPGNSSSSTTSTDTRHQKIPAPPPPPAATAYPDSSNLLLGTLPREPTATVPTAAPAAPPPSSSSSSQSTGNDSLVFGNELSTLLYGATTTQQQQPSSMSYGHQWEDAVDTQSTNEPTFPPVIPPVVPAPQFPAPDALMSYLPPRVHHVAEKKPSVLEKLLHPNRPQTAPMVPMAPPMAPIASMGPLPTATHSSAMPMTIAAPLLPPPPPPSSVSMNPMFPDYHQVSMPPFTTPPAMDPSLQRPPKKPRAKNVFRPCTAPGCTKGARGKSGLCQKHGGGKRCVAPGCTKGAQGSSNLCLFHGGGYRCTVEGCNTGARGTSGLCAKHGGYKRMKESSEDHSSSLLKRMKTQESSMFELFNHPVA